MKHGEFRWVSADTNKIFNNAADAMQHHKSGHTVYVCMFNGRTKEFDTCAVWKKS